MYFNIASNNFTRITEFKYFIPCKTDKTIVVFEYSQGFIIKTNEPYYPVFNDNAKHLCEKYKTIVGKERNVWFLGKLPEYKYYDIDDAVGNALKIFKEKIKPV